MSSSTRTQEISGFLAAAIFVFAASGEVVRMVVQGPWPGMTALLGTIVGIVLATLWALTALATATRWRSLAPFVFFGVFAFLPFFVLARAAGAPLVIGIGALVAMPVLVVLSLLAFGRTVSLGSRPSGASREIRPEV